MKKRIIAVLLLVLCMAGVLAGCGSKEVTEADLDRIAKYYFDMKLGEDNWEEYTRDKDTVVNAKEAFCLTAQALDGVNSYTIAILKDGSGVYNYSIITGKASRIGGSEVGK